MRGNGAIPPRSSPEPAAWQATQNELDEFVEEFSRVFGVGNSDRDLGLAPNQGLEWAEQQRRQASSVADMVGSKHASYSEDDLRDMYEQLFGAQPHQQQVQQHPHHHHDDRSGDHFQRLRMAPRKNDAANKNDVATTQNTLDGESYSEEDLKEMYQQLFGGHGMDDDGVSVRSEPKSTNLYPSSINSASYPGAKKTANNTDGTSNNVDPGSLRSRIASEDAVQQSRSVKNNEETALEIQFASLAGIKSISGTDENSHHLVLLRSLLALQHPIFTRVLLLKRIESLHSAGLVDASEYHKMQKSALDKCERTITLHCAYTDDKIFAAKWREFVSRG